MRDSFTWDTMPKLPETDVEGIPRCSTGSSTSIEGTDGGAGPDAHLLERAADLRALHVRPARKCGRVEHATDGRGVVVYALFPAKVFNIMRDFGIQAMRATWRRRSSSSSRARPTSLST